MTIAAAPDIFLIERQPSMIHDLKMEFKMLNSSEVVKVNSNASNILYFLFDKETANSNKMKLYAKIKRF